MCLRTEAVSGLKEGTGPLMKYKKPTDKKVVSDRKIIDSFDGDFAVILINGELIRLNKRFLPEGVKQGDRIEIFSYDSDRSPWMTPGTYMSAFIFHCDDINMTFGCPYGGDRIPLDKRILPADIIERSHGIMRTCVSLEMRRQFIKKIYSILMKEPEFDRHIFIRVAIYNDSFEDLASQLMVHVFKIKTAYYNVAHNLKMRGFDNEAEDIKQHILRACAIIIKKTWDDACDADPMLCIPFIRNLKVKYHRFIYRWLKSQ